MDRIAPTNEADLAQAVREAGESARPFEIVGRGSKRGYGRSERADTMLDMRGFSGVVKYEPEELVLTVKAATPMAEIEAILSTKNQMLGFEPADWGGVFGKGSGTATIGGIAASNACGARRIKAGAVRDHVIGCRFVNGMGDIVKAGGTVIKNVTGFDVARLMCGAFGTLGVMTEITLRVVPRPARVAALSVACSPAEGLGLSRMAAQSPTDPTGLAYLPGQAGRALIRIEGEQQSLRDKIAVLTKQLSGRDIQILDHDETGALFKGISDGAPLRDSNLDLWRLCVAPSLAHEALLESEAPRWYADWAGGLLWLAFPGDEGTAVHLRKITAKHGGHASLMRSSLESRREGDVFEPEVPARAALTRSVKDAFDPKRIFNPGRMFKDI